VLVPSARLGPLGAHAEAELLRSGRSGLVPVFHSRDWRIYELPDATPLLTGPARADFVTLSHERIEAQVATTGRYRLRVRYTPYWRVERGNVCLARARDGMTEVVARASGRFALTVGGPLGRNGAAC
jgi:hypothetical protein